MDATSKELSLEGRVIGPDDPDYDGARRVFLANFDRRPALVARVAGAGDVARVVSFARDAGLELAVRGGGHSAAGYGASEGGIVLDLSGMRAIEIDAERRTAWAEAGATSGEYTAAAGAHGLATGFGDAPSVGIGGITLGGGAGYLSRKHGLTIDDLLEAEIVTADGRVLRVDEETHPDLFWAIRGGGGNFGVATRLRFRLHELRSIVGGMLLLPATPEVIASFVARVQAAPDELSAVASVMRAPPMPFVPAEHHGELVLMATLVYAGGEEAGLRALEPFRALAAPIADMVRPMSYPEVFAPEDESFHPRAVGRAMFLDDFGRDAAELVLERLATATASMAAVQIRVLGGAVARVPADATAYAHRGRGMVVNVGAMYQRPEEAAAQEAWVTKFAAALSDGEPGVYVNFLGDEGEGRVREAYPGTTWDRLTAIKARYDPRNLFHLNQNIPPVPVRPGGGPSGSPHGGAPGSPDGRPGFSLDGRPARAGAS